MSQRASGYERKEADFYPTPAWVTRALLPHLRTVRGVWEPAAGDGAMVTPLIDGGLRVVASDIRDPGPIGTQLDFLAAQELPAGVDAIVTNPPYEIAPAFIETALRLVEPVGGVVAMLLRTDFDHARSRSHLFRDCPAFSKKLVLTKRIVWFEPEPGAKGKSPSFNHAWYVWDCQHEGPPAIAYGP